ncbi:MAG: zinc ABC transporter substrate-binding protein [Verrucomicrobiota bacterium]
MIHAGSRLPVLFFLLLLPCSCDRGPEISGKAAQVTEEPGKIYTTFYPTQYFTNRLVGNQVEVVCPVPADEDAIFWMPGREALAAYQAADLIVLNGAGFAKWVEKASLPPSRVVDTAAGFSDRFLRYENAIKHQHGPGGEHSHEGLDGHTWVDPLLAILQAEAIAGALKERWPDRAGEWLEGFAALEKDLRELDRRLTAFSKAWGQRPLLASHPAYNYLVQRYGWNLLNLDLDPETVPDGDVLHEIEHELEDHQARVLIWEGEPLPEVAERLEQKFGLINVVFSPVELLGEDERNSGEDYLTLMQGNLDRLEALLAPDRGLLQPTG